MALRELTDAELAGVAGGRCHGKKKKSKGGGARAAGGPPEGYAGSAEGPAPGGGASAGMGGAGVQQFSDDEVAKLRAMLQQMPMDK
jgi:hypothetical protein